MIEFTLANGKELDIPDGSIIMFEEMREDTNPNFPNARCFVRYALGGDVKTAVLVNKVEDVLFELGINATPAGWLKLTMKDSNLRVIIQVKNVVAREAIEDGCELTVETGAGVMPLTVNESRREIKKWSERPLAPIPTPAPEGE